MNQNQNEQIQNPTEPQPNPSAPPFEASYDNRTAMLLEDLKEAREDAEYYRTLVARQQNEMLLKELKELDPTINSISELGEDFEKLLDSGISLPVAFCAISTIKKGTTQPTMGDVKQGGSENELLSFEAVKAMSKEQIEKNYDKVMRSAAHWKKSKNLTI